LGRELNAVHADVAVVQDGFDVGESAQPGEGGGGVEGAWIGAQDGQAEAIVAADDGGSGAQGAEFGVAGDEAIAIEDDVTAGNDGGDRAGLGERGEGEAQAKEGGGAEGEALSETRPAKSRAGRMWMRERGWGDHGVTSLAEICIGRRSGF
jgi:hypothetical protein